MEVWQLVLYAAAAILAVRSLVALMAHHKQHMRHQLQLQFNEQQRTEAERLREAEAARDQPLETAA